MKGAVSVASGHCLLDSQATKKEGKMPPKPAVLKNANSETKWPKARTYETRDTSYSLQATVSSRCQVAMQRTGVPRPKLTPGW